jgi:hypothetical protein
MNTATVTHGREEHTETIDWFIYATQSYNDGLFFTVESIIDIYDTTILLASHQCNICIISTRPRVVQV